MKKISLVSLFVLLLSTFSVNAQSIFEKALMSSLGVRNIPSEKIGDSRMSEPGSVCLKTYYDMGEVKKILFQVVRSSDIQTGEVNYFGRFRFGGLSSNIVCIGTLTPGEIDKCIKMFLYAKESVINSSSTNYQELDFTNDLAYKIGFFKGSKEWKIFVSTNYFIDDNQIQVPASNIDEFIDVFQRMKKKIDELNQ